MKTNTATKTSRQHSILIVGYVADLSPQALAKSGYRTRHIYLITEYMTEYAVVDHFREGWRVTHTFFAEEAFSGDWSEVVAEASATDPAQMGQSGREVLRDVGHFLNTKTVRLVSPVRKPTPVPHFLQDLEAVAS